MISFVGCQQQNSKDESDNAESNPGTSQSTTDESQSTTSTELKCRPYATVDFIQEWMCQKWCDVEWGPHLDKLQKVGIEQIILQASYNVDENGNNTTQVFPDAEHEDNRGLEFLLQEAEKRGMKVWIGSNSDPSWWGNGFLNSDWITKQNDLNKKNMEFCYKEYKEKYPNAFYGFYYSWEMWNAKAYYGRWAEMFNRYIDDMNSIDPTMPILFSPFLSTTTNLSPEETGEMYERMLPRINFRKGDIFCPQDSYGGSGYSLELINKYEKSIYEASKSNENLTFWINVESFENDKAAPLDRYKSALETAAQYADNLATFSLSHHQADFKKYQKKMYDPYKEYYEQVKAQWDSKSKD